MIQPSIEEGKKYKENYAVVPISMEILSDFTTPIQVLKILKTKSKQCYLLESVEGGERWGRYSFLGFDPEKKIHKKDGVVTISHKNGSTQSTDCFEDVVQSLLNEYKSPKLPNTPIFTGGLVGYFSYDYSDIQLMLFEKVIAFDHLKQKIVLIVNIKTDQFESNYVNAVLELKELERMLQTQQLPLDTQAKLTSDFVPLFQKETFCNMVEKTKKQITEGDLYQCVIANRFTASFEGDLLNAYRILRTMNPSPYMFYLDFDGTQIAGASPETLISLKDQKLSTYPIAGTCKREKTAEEDAFAIQKLLSDEKELAEHHMLLDLSRNDLGKISNFGSVRVTEFQQAVKFSHVIHICSTVVSELQEGLTPIDGVKAVLPAGTLSGAPKKKAMALIQDIENVDRGIYGGAIGYIDFSGNMDLCIAIRMCVKKGDQVSVSAGAGIVADSIPENEYQECMNKAQAMIHALQRAITIGGIEN